MVPTFTCGLDRSNFSLAMSQEPRALVLSSSDRCLSLYPPTLRALGEPLTLVASFVRPATRSRERSEQDGLPTVARSVLLRPSGYGGQPPSESRAELEPMTRIELVTSSL